MNPPYWGGMKRRWIEIEHRRMQTSQAADPGPRDQMKSSNDMFISLPATERDI